MTDIQIVTRERDEARAELERVRRAGESCIADAQTAHHMAEADLERVQKQAAAMREALERCSRSWRWYVNNPAAPIAGITSMDAAIVACEDAISADAGKGYVPLEDVKPLCEALNCWLIGAPSAYSFPAETSEFICQCQARMRAALAHAKAKGLL